MTKKYKSKALASVHELMDGLYKNGSINKKTMKKFDKYCLTPVKPLSAKKIRAIRERECASQSVFAYYLNVSKNLISQWERGEKKPSGAALKLLTLVDKNGLGVIA